MCARVAAMHRLHTWRAAERQAHLPRQQHHEPARPHHGAHRWVVRCTAVDASTAAFKVMLISAVLTSRGVTPTPCSALSFLNALHSLAGSMQSACPARPTASLDSSCVSTSISSHQSTCLHHAGRPSQEDLDAIQSPFAGTMMESCSVTQVRMLCQPCSRHSRQRHQQRTGRQ